jgi:hypothetical protein
MLRTNSENASIEQSNNTSNRWIVACGYWDAAESKSLAECVRRKRATFDGCGVVSVLWSVPVAVVVICCDCLQSYLICPLSLCYCEFRTLQFDNILLRSRPGLTGAARPKCNNNLIT